MPRLQGLILGACVVLLIAGGVALLAQPADPPVVSSVRPVPSFPTSAPPPSSSHPSNPPPGGTVSEADLLAQLLVADDLGGYYTPVPAESAKQLSGSGCLASLGRVPGAVHQVTTFLEGPYQGQLPIINEQLSALPSPVVAADAYRAATAALSACRAPGFSIHTTSVPVALQPLSIPALGDEAMAVQGTYSVQGRTERLTVVVARDGGTIVVVLYADAVPVSNVILGDVTSTVRAAVGKAAH